MLARELRVVSGTAAIVVLCRVFQVGLGANTLAPSIATGAQLVENVFPLVFMVVVFREHGKIGHHAYACLPVVLVVDRLAQIVGSVVLRIVYAEEVVLHVLVGFTAESVVQGGNQSHSSFAYFPSSVHRCRELQVAQGFGRTCGPVVFTGQRAQPVVEPKEVGCRPFGVSEVAKVGGIVPVAAHRDGCTVLRGNVFRVDK